MRKLVYLTIGFAASCGLCAYGIWKQSILLPSAAIFFLVFLFGSVFSAERKWMRCTALLFLGGAIGFLWFFAFRLWYLQPVDTMIHAQTDVCITSAEYGVDTGYGTRVDGILMQDGKPYRIRTYLKEQQSIQPGDVLNGSFDIRYVKQGASAYFSSKGIFLCAYENEAVSVSESETVPFWCYPAILRNRIQSLLNESFPSDVAPFANALLLGDASDFDYATETAFKVSGIRHIIAVSGLHISILYGLICLITFRQRFLTAALGIPVLLLFAAVAGFTPSVVRACIMVWLMLLAMIFDREYDPPTALAFSVLVMLAANPMAVTSVSLQMSVTCVAGILLFQKRIHSWLKTKITPGFIPGKVCAMLCSSISVSLSAMSLVTPVSAFYFGTVSLVAVVTNILTLWAVSLCFYGLILVCVLGCLLPGLAKLIAYLLAWPMRYVLFTARFLSSVPLAAVYTKSVYIVFWLVFVYVLLALFLMQKKKHPDFLFCCGVLGLCFALLASWTEPMMDSVRITMLDVGQGQSILLQSDGKTYLVDCGGDDDADTADRIAETLLSQGIARLDGILLTHYDQDHSGALHNLLTRIDADLLILPDTRNTFLLPDTDAEILWIWDDAEIRFGDSRLAVYGPVYSGLDNENSLCVLFDTEKCDILITGDRTDFGERMLLRKADLPDVDILVAGHHGAADSTSEELLNAVTPEIVLISVRENNRYGHPSEKLLHRLDRFGCTVFRTDRDGTITIRR